MIDCFACVCAGTRFAIISGWYSIVMFFLSFQVQNLEMLLQGFDDEDPDMVRQALNHPFIKHMDVEYARLARDLPLPEGISAPKASVVRENAAASYVSPKATGVTTADIEVSIKKWTWYTLH